MGQIDWGRTPEQEHATVRRVVQEIYEDLYDNGTPGFIPRVEKFMSEYNGAALEQQRMHQQNSDKLNRQSTKLTWIMAFSGLAAVIVSIIAIIVGVEMAKRSELDPARIFHSQSQPEVAHNQKTYTATVE